MPTAEQLRLAEILDSAGFAYLEVSGGGCFEWSVKRGVESPWERIRAFAKELRAGNGAAANRLAAEVGALSAEAARAVASAAVGFRPIQRRFRRTQQYFYRLSMTRKDREAD